MVHAPRLVCESLANIFGPGQHIAHGLHQATLKPVSTGLSHARPPALWFPASVRLR